MRSRRYVTVHRVNNLKLHSCVLCDLIVNNMEAILATELMNTNK